MSRSCRELRGEVDRGRPGDAVQAARRWRRARVLRVAARGCATPVRRCPDPGRDAAARSRRRCRRRHRSSISKKASWRRPSASAVARKKGAGRLGRRHRRMHVRKSASSSAPGTNGSILRIALRQPRNDHDLVPRISPTAAPPRLLGLYRCARRLARRGHEGGACPCREVNPTLNALCVSTPAALGRSARRSERWKGEAAVARSTACRCRSRS